MKSKNEYNQKLNSNEGDRVVIYDKERKTSFNEDIDRLIEKLEQSNNEREDTTQHNDMIEINNNKINKLRNLKERNVKEIYESR